ncbi:MAG: HDIG domain-containing protein [Gemmatimonadetes bacterium]|nr:HDIG domain-containing protein [Gemmatimonadota bacterium]
MAKSGKGPRASWISGVPGPAWPDTVVHHAVRAVVLLVCATGLTLMFPTDPGVSVGRFEPGTVAQRTVIAVIDFEVPQDPGVLRRQREEAAAAVVPTFTSREAARDSAVTALAAFFARVDSAVAEGGVAGVAAVLSAARIDADPEHVQLLADRSAAGRLQEDASTAITTLAARGVMAPEAASRLNGDSIRVVRGGVESVVGRNTVLSGRQFYELALENHEPGPESDLLRLILARYLAPTLLPDTRRTNREMAEARDTVPTTIRRVLEGEAIIRANSQVGPGELQALDAYRASLRAQGYNVEGTSFGSAFGGFLINSLILAIFGLLMLFFRPDVYRQFRFLVTIAAIVALYFVGAFFVARVGLPWASLPIVFVTVALSIMWDGRLALITAFVLCTLTIAQTPFASVEVFLVTLTGGGTAALAVRRFRRLAQIWIFIAITVAAYSLVISAIELRGSEIPYLSALLWGVMSTVGGATLAIGFIPIFEWVTGITTDQTLISLSDPNRPLLRRLAAEAPGTFAHSVQVANLAEAGADDIGANALLCRAGAYYHDVGKLISPGSFIENQEGDNPHDRMDAAASAAIVRDHVVEGAKMARRDKVPRVVIDHVREHHGDQTISFFYERARAHAEAEGLEAPDPAAFRYPGPRPRSRETAVLMLADSVESAARAMKNPTRERIRRLIEDIFAMKIDRGQLDGCPLTFEDLSRLKRRFARVLGGIYHRRIDYPGTRHLNAEEGDGR